jgi:hypothetical protein
MSQSAIEVFEEMLDRIGIEGALALQMSIALKISDAVKHMQNAELTPQECAFMAIWIDSLVELKVGQLMGDVEEGDDDNPFEVGRPGGGVFG